MAELTAPQQNRLLGQLANMLRATEGDIAAPEFLPSQLDVMGLVRQLMLPSAETVEKLSYGDPLFRMPMQSNIPITADREYLADVVGMAPMVPAASSGATRLTNEAADQLVRAITRNPEATAPGVLEAAGEMLPLSRMISPEIAARALPKTKVVDETGKPQIMFHATHSENLARSGEFDPLRSEIGSHIGTIEQAQDIFGGRQTYGRGASVLPVYADIKNPLRLIDKGDFRQSALEQLIDKKIVNPNKLWWVEDAIVSDSPVKREDANKAIQKAIKDAGYDGIVYLNRREGNPNPFAPGIDKLTDEQIKKKFPQLKDSYIVFEPAQIKSAISDPELSGLLNP